MSGARPDPAGPLLELRGLHHRFGATEVIRGVDLAVRPGERLAVIGPNGAGKSTLFHLISGRYRPTAGHVVFEGQRIDGLSPPQIQRRGMARSFQRSQLFGGLSVADNLRCALLRQHELRQYVWRPVAALASVQRRLAPLLDDLGLAAVADQPAASIPYALQRALDLGLALAGDARVLLLDEPTAGMSRSESMGFVERLRRLSEGRTLMLVEHDMGVVFGLADRIAVIAQGRVLACDTPEAVRRDPRVREAYLGHLPEAA